MKILQIETLDISENIFYHLDQNVHVLRDIFLLHTSRRPPAENQIVIRFKY